MKEIQEELHTLFKKGLQFLGVAGLGYLLNTLPNHPSDGSVYKLNQILMIFAMFVALCYFTGVAYQAYKGKQKYPSQNFSKYYIPVIILLIIYTWMTIR